MPQREPGANQLAQRAVNTWGTSMQTGHDNDLSADFKALLDKTCAYRIAKNVADNRRKHDLLTVAEAVQEQVTQREFLDAYRAFYEARQ